MLKITIPAIELYDDETEEFISSKEQTIILEHSLVSISKWESKWRKPFLGKEKKTPEESVDYIKCMTITQNVDSNVYRFIPGYIMEQISNYIETSMTATTFADDKKTINRETITSEIIYYWMIALNIPPEYQKWHLSRLLTLINVCNIKNQPAKKRSRKEIMERNRALNEARRNKLNTKG